MEGTRNYKVSFRKVKDVLQFQPGYSVRFGVEELLRALQMGVFRNSDNRHFHGNYEIFYKSLIRPNSVSFPLWIFLPYIWLGAHL